MHQPDYSVIIPAYQAAEEIGRCVQALNCQSIPRERYEIIVVDDGSTDGTADIARAAGADRVVLIPHAGPAVARNAGLETARGEIVLFTDADCEPSPTWLERMVAPFSDPEVMGAKGTYRTRQRSPIARLVQLEYEFRYERMAQAARIDFVDTYAAAYRRTLLVQTDGFDPTFPIPSAEDVDLSFRLAQAGHRLVFVPEAWVWHAHPDRLWSYLMRKARYGFWRALLYLRHPEKVWGDTHTDPRLKVQFALVALFTLCLMGGLVWPPLAAVGVLMLLGFLSTTVPFICWAWSRDRWVALIWPGVTLARVFVQGVGLALGFVYHGILARRRAGPLPRRAVAGPEKSDLGEGK